MHYLKVRMEDSVVVWFGTMAFTKVALCGFIGINNITAGGVIAAAGGAILLVRMLLNNMYYRPLLWLS